jgi:hypothetical protein
MSTHKYRQSPPQDDDDDVTQGVLIAIAIIGVVVFVFSDGIIHILGW